MVIPLLILMLGIQDNSAEVGRLQGEVQRLSSELNGVQRLVQNELRPMCTAESRFQPINLRITNPQTPLLANLLGMVSNPADSCLPADIRVTATYFDPADTFVCSGTVTIPQAAAVQNTMLEFRPYELEVFVKWWDGATLRQQALVCRDYQRNEMRSPGDAASSLRLYVTVAPKRGGLSTNEIQVTLPRFPRQ